ncbi:SDA1-domain-containing protein [Aureobasidium subglaciale]|nr:SDA1-domain-containing protein [Aureobasidium subglaciale]
MVKRKVGALEKVDADLPNLQYKVRRDPASYKDDFNNQYSQYQAFLQLFMQAPSSTDSQGLVSLRELIDFVAHCADCYPKLTADFPTDLMALLRLHHAELEPELRDKVVGSLVLLRKKDIIDSAVLLNALFPLLVDTPSKALRTLLFTKIISDLRTSNSKSTNHKLNRTIQTVLYNLLTSDPTSAKGVWAVRITREMWARQIWTDAKAVEIMKEAALSQHEKVVSGGVHFFLGGDKEREDKAEEDSDDEENIDMGKLRHQAGINKKTKKKANELRRAAATVKRKEKKKKAPHPLNFSALHLLHDPQGFAERLFHQHLNTQTPKAKLKLDQKLIVLQLVSRLVGLHTLTLIPLYSYFIKYLTPKQPQVTSFLASLAQSTHSLVPPDALEPLVQKIANEFVSEAAASEVASAGLNAIREICVRQPLAMNETLLQDLVEYRKSKDKGVVMAAKGLLSLYREVGPEMLRRRDRGKDASIGIQKGTLKDRKFGQVEVGGIEGLELLEEWKAEERRKRRVEKGLDPDASDADEDEEEEDEEAGWSKWDLEEDDDSDEEGWINVESDGEEIDISDSEDEGKKPKAKKQKTDVEPMKDADDTPKDPVAEFSKLATTRILTPADLAKLQELRTSAAVSKHMPSQKRQQQGASGRHADDPLTAAEIEGLAALSSRATREEKIALAKGDRDEKHMSTTAKRKEKKESEGKSTTNKEKARKKNFLMTLGKAKRKGKRSLVEHRKILRGHIDRQKRGDDADHDLWISEKIEDRASIFQAWFSPTMPAKELQKLDQFKDASHRILAWRSPSSQRTLVGNVRTLETGTDDDGERYGGRHVLKVIEEMRVEGAIVVARWYGGVMLGPARFAHIENSARDAIRAWRQKEDSEGQKRRRIEDEDMERASLIVELTDRDQNILVLRKLLEEKTKQIQPQSNAEPKTSSRPSVPAPDYNLMPIDRLRQFDKARDSTVAFLLKKIDEAEKQISLRDANLDAKSPSPILAEMPGAIVADQAHLQTSAVLQGTQALDTPGKVEKPLERAPQKPFEEEESSDDDS